MVGGYQRFGGDTASIFRREDTHNLFLRNISTQPPDQWSQKTIIL
jgi:hypothetical protein